jgi:hypothetical protein
LISPSPYELYNLCFINNNFESLLTFLGFHLTFPVADVPEPDPQGIPLGVLAPVKECALAMLLK